MKTLCAVFLEFSSSQKVMDKWGGAREYQAFPSETFCLIMPHFFLGEHFIFSIISRIQKLYANEGNITFLYRKSVV